MTARDEQRVRYRAAVSELDALAGLEADQGQVVVRGLGPIEVSFDPAAAPRYGAWRYVLDDDGTVVRQWDRRRCGEHEHRVALAAWRRATGELRLDDRLGAPPATATPWSAAPRGRNLMPATVSVDAILEALTRTTTDGTAARSWPGLVRAEHIVVDVDAANAATPHGTVATTTGASVARWVEALAADRMSRFLGKLPLVEVGSAPSSTLLPTFTTAPTAGPQNGQKLAAFSKAFEVSPDAGTTIDSTLHLNVSLQLDAMAAGVVERFARLAVVAEAEAQVVAALEANATSAADLPAALDTFDGLYTPTLIVTSPGGLVALGPSAAIFAASGISVAVVPTATTTLVLDPSSIVGYLVQAAISAVEPSVIGRGYTEMLWGRVGISGAGVAAVATTP